MVSWFVWGERRCLLGHMCGCRDYRHYVSSTTSGFCRPLPIGLFRPQAHASILAAFMGLPVDPSDLSHPPGIKTIPINHDNHYAAAKRFSAWIDAVVRKTKHCRVTTMPSTWTTAPYPGTGACLLRFTSNNRSSGACTPKLGASSKTFRLF